VSDVSNTVHSQAVYGALKGSPTTLLPLLVQTYRETWA
jgi:hypothetical protein